MSHRHLSRSVVLQTLFEWDFEKKDPSLAEAIFERDVREFAPGTNDRPRYIPVVGLMRCRMCDVPEAFLAKCRSGKSVM